MTRGMPGVENSKRLLEDIPNKIQNSLGIVADVNRLVKDGRDYIEIRVSPSSFPISYHGEFHYRSRFVSVYHAQNWIQMGRCHC